MSSEIFNGLVRWNDTVTTTHEEWYMEDASGNRILRRSQTGTGASNTSITIYAFGLEEHLYDGSGTLKANTYYYSLGGRLLGKSSGSGALTFFLTDTLGSVLASFSGAAGTTNEQGNQTFGPYGNTQYSAGQLGTNKGFTGQYKDDLSGLNSFGVRYYDPVVGVFLSADTAQGNPSGDNPYAYVGGNPETFNDPTGQMRAPGCFQGCSGEPPGYSSGVTAGLGSGGGGESPNLSDACSQLGGCKVGAVIDTGTTVVRVSTQSAPGCVAGVMGLDGFSVSPCFAGVGGSSIFYRANNPPTNALLCIPTLICIEGDVSDSSDTGSTSNKDDGVSFAMDAGEGGPEFQPKRVPEENVQAVVGEVGAESSGNERPVNSKGQPYPKMIDPRTGNEVPFPSGDLQKVQDLSDRVVWNNITRGDFIAEWIDRGYPDYGKAGWKQLDIHHILPREFGGTNDFWNLVPLETVLECEAGMLHGQKAR